ncbi:MAG: hypothetical protein AAGC71_03915 [Pseudomonadota bacterium]
MLEWLLLMRLGGLHCDPAELPVDVAAGFVEFETEGFYQNTFEQSVLKSCGDDRRDVWINSDSLRALYRENYETMVDEKSFLYVRVKGRVSPKGAYGHMGRYRYCLTAVVVESHRLIAMDTAYAMNCGRRWR